MSIDQNDYLLPEGWKIDPSFAETVGPKIKKKSHLVGDQDKSKMLDEEIGDDMDMSEEEYAYWCECEEKMEEEEEEADYADDGKKYTHTYDMGSEFRSRSAGVFREASRSCESLVVKKINAPDWRPCFEFQQLRLGPLPTALVKIKPVRSSVHN